MISTIILLITGVIIFSTSLVYLIKYLKILKTGIKTTGIIFAYENEQTSTSNFLYPVVRFLTKEEVWVTKSANIGFYPKKFKLGSGVAICYLENNANSFIIDDKSAIYSFILLIIIGLIIIIYSTIQLLQIIPQ